MLNIALVAGSSRNNSQSGKVARALRQRLVEMGKTTQDCSSIIDLGLAPLPLWPAEMPAHGRCTNSNWPPPMPW